MKWDETRLSLLETESEWSSCLSSNSLCSIDNENKQIYFISLNLRNYERMTNLKPSSIPQERMQ